MLICYYTGADVIHPAPGSDGRPSFTALVANVDSDTAKYIAGEFSYTFGIMIITQAENDVDSRVQTSRQEMIEELDAMSEVCDHSILFLFCHLNFWIACSVNVHALS